MKLPRRKFLHLAAGAAALPAVFTLRLGTSLSDADSHRKFSLSLLNGLAGWNCQTSPSLTLHRLGLFLV